MKKLLLSVILGSAVLTGWGQDIHFSQYSSSPLTLNPALTGLTPCTYRFALNYRNQWASVVGPASYQTYSGSFDIGAFRKKLNNSMFGFGVMMFNDVSGDGSLSNLTAMGSVAYHQNLGHGNHYFSLGFQGGMVQKKVDYTKLIFESQIGTNGVDPTLPSGEYGDDNDTYFDMNVGANWYSRFSDKFVVQIGGAYEHLGEPVESFYGDNTNRLNAHYIGYGSLKIGLGKKSVFIPSFLYMQQTEGSNTEMLGGANLGFQLEKGISMLYLGSYYRLVDNGQTGDAVVADVGFDYNNINFGLSYDINISTLSTVSNYRGGIELALIYWGCINTEHKESPIDCPKF